MSQAALSLAARKVDSRYIAQNLHLSNVASCPLGYVKRDVLFWWGTCGSPCTIQLGCSGQNLHIKTSCAAACTFHHYQYCALYQLNVIKGDVLRSEKGQGPCCSCPNIQLGFPGQNVHPKHACMSALRYDTWIQGVVLSWRVGACPVLVGALWQPLHHPSWLFWAEA